MDIDSVTLINKARKTLEFNIQGSLPPEWQWASKAIEKFKEDLFETKTRAPELVASYIVKDHGKVCFTEEGAKASFSEAILKNKPDASEKQDHSIAVAWAGKTENDSDPSRYLIFNQKQYLDFSRPRPGAVYEHAFNALTHELAHQADAENSCAIANGIHYGVHSNSALFKLCMQLEEFSEGGNGFIALAKKSLLKRHYTEEQFPEEILAIATDHLLHNTYVPSSAFVMQYAQHILLPDAQFMATHDKQSSAMLKVKLSGIKQNLSKIVGGQDAPLVKAWLDAETDEEKLTAKKALAPRSTPVGIALNRYLEGMVKSVEKDIGMFRR